MIISVTAIYIAILGLLFIPFTGYVIAYRRANQISLGEGSDREMQRRIRAQGNFAETVPLALIILVALELLGANSNLLHALGTTLVVGRVIHYLQIVGALKPLAFRVAGMALTFLVYLLGSIGIILQL